MIVADYAAKLVLQSNLFGKFQNMILEIIEQDIGLYKENSGKDWHLLITFDLEEES